MLDIRDKTFDVRFFTNILDIMDSYYLSQKLIGRNPEYCVVNAGQNSQGYIHRIVLRNSDINTGFSLFLYENQSLTWKGYFRFQFKDVTFNLQESNAFLKSIGIKKVDKKHAGIRWAFAVYLDNIEEQLPLLVARYSKYVL